jgi:outer membrane protein assembly factor BamB
VVKGDIQAQWVAEVPYTVSTPLCSTPDTLYFGCVDNKLYELPKARATKPAAVHSVWRVDGNFNEPPVAPAGAAYPFYADDKGNLYRYNGVLGTEQKPVRGDVGSPAVPMVVDGRGGVLLIASTDYRLTALDDVTGRDLKWTAFLGDVASGELYLQAGTVYVHTDEHRLFALRTSDGEKMWKGKAIEGVQQVIGPSKEGNLYLLMDGNRIAKLNTASGEIVFTRTLPDCDFIMSNRATGTVYLGVREGWFWAIRER